MRGKRRETTQCEWSHHKKNSTHFLFMWAEWNNDLLITISECVCECGVSQVFRVFWLFSNWDWEWHVTRELFQERYNCIIYPSVIIIDSLRSQKQQIWFAFSIHIYIYIYKPWIKHLLIQTHSHFMQLRFLYNV